MKFDEQEEQFIRFIGSFGEFYKPAYIIASNNSGKSILSKKRGKNRFSLYSLDEICRSADIFREDHLEFYPKTTDAIWFKKSEKGYSIYF